MKAILVIDIPDDFFEYYGQLYENFYVECDLRAKHKYEMVDETLWLTQECPLKPLPQKMKADYDTISSCEVTEKVVAMGWNACISAILGEEE